MFYQEGIEHHREIPSGSPSTAPIGKVVVPDSGLEFLSHAEEVFPFRIVRAYLFPDPVTPVNEFAVHRPIKFVVLKVFLRDHPRIVFVIEILHEGRVGICWR